MEALLTSFGIDLQGRRHPAREDVFYRMPPTAFELRGRYLVPAYGVLLLCDRLVIDVQSFERLIQQKSSAYSDVADVIVALHGEGFLRIEDYSKRVSAAHGTIRARVRAAIRSADWQDALSESITLWSRFITTASNPLRIDGQRSIFQHQLDISNSSTRAFLHAVSAALMTERVELDLLKEQTKRESETGRIIENYLTYVEINIELSRQLQIPIHDWADYGPFYSRRLAQSTLQSPFQRRVTQVTRLFDITFPEFKPQSASTLLRLLKDKRVESLRALVGDAANGVIEFDREFAVKTLFEVIRTEERIARFRSVTSYALLPAGYIPVVGTPLAKAGEETAGIVFEQTVRTPLNWFYLLSETHDHPGKSLAPPNSR